MKYIPRGFTVRVGVWIVLTIAAVPALAQTPITSCPFSIDSPGNYVLTTDLTCERSGISIGASNVSLNLNGHKIFMTGESGTAIAVRGVRHVGIHGPGLIQGPADLSTRGILLEGASYSQVSKVTIATSWWGIYADVCDFLTLQSNVIGHSGGGVFMVRTNSTTVSGNDLNGNGIGISLFLGSGNTVNNNIASGNSGSGIRLWGTSGPRVYGNVTNGNALYGIESLQTSAQVFSNTSKANGTFDLSGSCDNLWSDNVFFTANAPCIR